MTAHHVATLANVEAVVGDELALPDRFVIAMFDVAKRSALQSAPHLLATAALKQAWVYQRMVRRTVRPWKREWNWGADDRICLANEIIERVAASNEVRILAEYEVRSRLIEVCVQYGIEVNVEDFAGQLIVIGSSKLKNSINTCRLVWDSLFLHPERQILWV